MKHIKGKGVTWKLYQYRSESRAS